MSAPGSPRAIQSTGRTAAEEDRLERAPFVASLRARPETLSVDGGGDWMVRVQVLEMWDMVRLETAPTALVRVVKEQALASLMPDASHPGDFVTKLNGAEVLNEEQSLQDAGVLNGSTLLLTNRRRQPVR